MDNRPEVYNVLGPVSQHSCWELKISHMKELNELWFIFSLLGCQDSGKDAGACETNVGEREGRIMWPPALIYVCLPRERCAPNENFLHVNTPYGTRARTGGGRSGIPMVIPAEIRSTKRVYHPHRNAFPQKNVEKRTYVHHLFIPGQVCGSRSHWIVTRPQQWGQPYLSWVFSAHSCFTIILGNRTYLLTLCLRLHYI